MSDPKCPNCATDRRVSPSRQQPGKWWCDQCASHFEAAVPTTELWIPATPLAWHGLIFHKCPEDGCRARFLSWEGYERHWHQSHGVHVPHGHAAKMQVSAERAKELGYNLVYVDDPAKGTP